MFQCMANRRKTAHSNKGVKRLTIFDENFEILQ